MHKFCNTKSSVDCSIEKFHLQQCDCISVKVKGDLVKSYLDYGM